MLETLDPACIGLDIHLGTKFEKPSAAALPSLKAPPIKAAPANTVLANIQKIRQASQARF